jgi:hypothetical protein
MVTAAKWVVTTVPLLHSSVWHMLKVWNQKTDTN